MKLIFTLFLVLSACIAKAQVTVNFGGGVSNAGKMVANIEAGYQFNKIKINTGYLVSITDESEVHDVFFLKAGHLIKLSPKSSLDIGTGLALNTYKREQVSKVDQRYSYFKTINAGKPLLYVNYQKLVISDGAFYIQALYTGGILYAGAGLTYFFGQKNK